MLGIVYEKRKWSGQEIRQRYLNNYRNGRTPRNFAECQLLPDIKLLGNSKYFVLLGPILGAYCLGDNCERNWKLYIIKVSPLGWTEKTTKEVGLRERHGLGDACEIYKKNIRHLIPPFNHTTSMHISNWRVFGSLWTSPKIRWKVYV